MAIDPSIALGVRPIQIADPLAQYGQLAAIQNAQNQGRAAENQNALAQYTIAKARRDDMATEAMNELYSKHYNPTTGAVNQNALFQDLAARNLGSKISDIQAKLLEQQSKKTTIAKNEAETEASQFKTAQDKLNHGITSMAAASTPDMAIEKVKEAVNRGYFDQATGDKMTQELQSMTTPDQYQQYRQGKVLGIMQAHDQLNATAPKPTEVNLNNKKIFLDLNPNSPTFKQEVAPAQTMSATPGEMMTNARERERIANTENPNVVAKTVTGEDGTVTQFNKFGKVIGTVKGGMPSATYQKTQAQQKQLNQDRSLAISELDSITKDGGLIDQSTGSYAGKAVDIGARVFGKATPGDIAAGKLAPIADIVLKMIPRFEGPQSDKDTASYKQAAGQLADTMLPAEIRKEAGKELLRLMKARQGQFITQDMSTGNTAVPSAVAPPSGFVAD